MPQRQARTLPSRVHWSINGLAEYPSNEQTAHRLRSRLFDYQGGGRQREGLLCHHTDDPNTSQGIVVNPSCGSTRSSTWRVSCFTSPGKTRRALSPLGSGETFVPAQEYARRNWADFIVEWAGERPISEPLIEAVMLGISGSQGFSFTSRGQTMIPATPR